MAEPGALDSAAVHVRGDRSSVPPMPVIRGGEWGDWPHVLVDSKHLSIGWRNRPAKKGGQCFLVGRSSAMTGTKVLETFPFTAEGWAKAWRFLIARDRTLEQQLRKELTDRAAAERTRTEVAELDSSALLCLPNVFFLGGYATDTVLATGKPFDVRFLGDRVMITQPRQAELLLDVPYGEVEEIEVGGRGIVSKMSREGQAAMALVFGLVGAAIAYTDTKIQTIVRMRIVSGEFYFLCTTKTPDELRIQLSRPLGMIRNARAAEAPASGLPAGKAAAAVEELTRLASLLEAGLLTRDEFDRLKAQLLAGT